MRVHRLVMSMPPVYHLELVTDVNVRLAILGTEFIVKVRMFHHQKAIGTVMYHLFYICKIRYIYFSRRAQIHVCILILRHKRSFGGSILTQVAVL